jgi:hypothetical protein
MKKISFKLYYQESTVNPDYQKKMVALYNKDGSLRMVCDIDKAEILNYLHENKYIDTMDLIFGSVHLLEKDTDKQFTSIDEFLFYASK